MNVLNSGNCTPRLDERDESSSKTNSCTLPVSPLVDPKSRVPAQADGIEAARTAARIDNCVFIRAAPPVITMPSRGIRLPSPHPAHRTARIWLYHRCLAFRRQPSEGNGMRVVLYGATGMIGGRILKELLSRGHAVTAVLRDPSKLSPQANLTIEKGDLLDPDSIAKLAWGADVIVSSYGP